MKSYVGTSGWYYDWNVDGTLDWYIEKSQLNTIELNASFYRFPFKNQIMAWDKKSRELHWVIKMNRFVTHIHKLNTKSYKTYTKFIKLFKPLDKKVLFYLLQLPPNFSTNAIGNLKRFINEFDTKKIALEFRHKSWYDFDFNQLDFNGAIVSPDSPDISKKIFNKNGIVYIRFHGRGNLWYSYKYKKKELEETARLAVLKRPKKIIAFFNNDHNMLENARYFKKLV